MFELEIIGKPFVFSIFEPESIEQPSVRWAERWSGGLIRSDLGGEGSRGDLIGISSQAELKRPLISAYYNTTISQLLDL